MTAPAKDQKQYESRHWSLVIKGKVDSGWSFQWVFQEVRTQWGLRASLIACPASCESMYVNVFFPGVNTKLYFQSEDFNQSLKSLSQYYFKECIQDLPKLCTWSQGMNYHNLDKSQRYRFYKSQSPALVKPISKPLRLRVIVRFREHILL